jgi:hypothetical protein
MIQAGSRAEIIWETGEGHLASCSICEIVNISSKTVEIKYCSKVAFEGDKVSPIMKREIITANKVRRLKELC